MDPAEIADSALDWWERTGRKCFWSYLAGVWTMLVLIYLAA